MDSIIKTRLFLNRSRSRSPSESKTRLPEELKKHLEFELVETEGMTDEQLREIPYTAVKTSLKSSNSPPLSSKRKTYSSRRAKRSELNCILFFYPFNVVIIFLTLYSRDIVIHGFFFIL